MLEVKAGIGRSGILEELKQFRESSRGGSSNKGLPSETQVAASDPS